MVLCSLLQLSLLEQVLGLDDLQMCPSTLTILGYPCISLGTLVGGALQKGKGFCPCNKRITAATGQTSPGSDLTDPCFQIHRKLRS